MYVSRLKSSVSDCNSSAMQPTLIGYVKKKKNMKKKTISNYLITKKDKHIRKSPVHTNDIMNVYVDIINV